MVRDFDDNEFPLAYLISFRAYGTWLHGDKRGSMSRKQNKYGTPPIAPNPRLQQAEIKQLKHPPLKLNHSRILAAGDQHPDQPCAHGSFRGH